jgi:hypothetical protein
MYWCFLLRAGGFCCSLNVFYKGLGITIVQFCKMLQILVIKSLDPDSDPHWPIMLDLIDNTAFFSTTFYHFDYRSRANFFLPCTYSYDICSFFTLILPWTQATKDLLPSTYQTKVAINHTTFCHLRTNHKFYLSAWRVFHKNIYI